MDRLARSHSRLRIAGGCRSLRLWLCGTRRLRDRLGGRRGSRTRRLRCIRAGMRGVYYWGLRGLRRLNLSLRARRWNALCWGVGLFRRLRGRRSRGSRRCGRGSRGGRRGSGGTASWDELGLDRGPRLLLEHRTHGGIDGAERQTRRCRGWAVDAGLSSRE